MMRIVLHLLVLGSSNRHRRPVPSNLIDLAATLGTEGLAVIGLSSTC